MRLDVHVTYDPDLGVWYVLDSDVPGLHVEAATFDQLVEVIDDVLPDLVRTNLPALVGGGSTSVDIRVSRPVDLTSRPAA